MKDLKIVRENVTASTSNKFEFSVDGFEFLVKNFTSGDIYVAFENTTETDDMTKIPSMAGQVVIRNKKSTSGNTTKEIYVYPTASGEVEVQCLKF